MNRLPSLRLCLELLRLRRRLPSLVERLSLDELLKELDAEFFRGGGTRAALDRAVEATEALVRKGKLAPDTCLFRALSRYAVLHAHGVDAAFCMGVEPPPREEAGHAWVEDEDGPYLEEIADGAYVVTFTHRSPDRVDLETTL